MIKMFNNHPISLAWECVIIARLGKLVKTTIVGAEYDKYDLSRVVVTLLSKKIKKILHGHNTSTIYDKHI